MMAVVGGNMAAAILTISRRAVGAWIAHIAAAGLVLSHPLAEGIATAVIAIDLINRQHRATARQIADDTRLEALIAVIPGLTDRRNRDAETRNRSEEGEDFFHVDELGVRELSTQLFEAYSAAMKKIPAVSKRV
jgi:hypothetical protein